MHEMAIAEGILDVVLDVAQDNPVKTVRVQAGVLHAIVPELGVLISTGVPGHAGG